MKPRIRWILPFAAVALAIGACQPPKKPPPPPYQPASTIGPINFEAPTYDLGPIDGQDGWSATEANGFDYDQDVAANSAFPGSPGSFGEQSYRLSNAITGTSFGDQPTSPPLAHHAGETTATDAGMSAGDLQPYFEAEWEIASAVPAEEQEGLRLNVSPTRGDESRASLLQIEDVTGGLRIVFFDTPGETNPAVFESVPVAEGLDRSVPHTIRITIEFVDGASNDVVRVFVDGTLVHTGTSFENYFRFDAEALPEGGPRTVDSLMFYLRGTDATGTAGEGFLVENVSLFSGPVP